MSMITGCPACGTMFRVVPDQLKISDGWVRCGQCGEVFDATGNLRPDARPVPAPAQVPRADRGGPLPVPPADPAALKPAPALPSAELHADPAIHPAPPHPDRSPHASGGHRIGPDADASAAIAIAMPLTAADPAASVHPAPAWVRPAGADSRFDSMPGGDRAGDEVEDEPEQARDPHGSELAEVSFLRQARRKAFWRRPLVRLLLVFALLALGGLLALQVGVHERDRLAAAQPQLRPLLESVCERLACTIGAPRRIEAIVIDSSGFTRLRPDVYRLSFALKNQSRAPVALPALQLTLTDAQEQAVIQRVLLPGELGAASASLAAAAEWSTSVALAVSSGDTAAGRVAGYRLLAFYP